MSIFKTGCQALVILSLCVGSSMQHDTTIKLYKDYVPTEDIHARFDKMLHKYNTQEVIYDDDTDLDNYKPIYAETDSMREFKNSTLV